MKSLKQLYKKGIGPSSSHTMGPAKAVEKFLSKHGNCQNYVVTLYGSLALTGEGHGTDRAILHKFGQRSVQIIFDKTSPCPHPNTMDFVGYVDGKEQARMQVYSIGGGAILVAGEKIVEEETVYPHDSFQQIKAFCVSKNIALWQYPLQFEGEEILRYALEMWQAMKNSVNEGLNTEGVLPGGLGVVRKAHKLISANNNLEQQAKDDRLVAAYAFAVSEQNAAGGEIVTAPTCGASGVLPAVFMFYQTQFGYTDEEIAKALLAAGVIGNLVKTNASISGAECGCQAEIGTACAMAAGGLASLKGMTIDEIEYSAEVALEHHLGLTCDPVCGLVQIPCIERNAVAAMRAINAVSLATFLTDSRKISLDTVISTMYETGRDIAEGYRETSIGGLAKHYKPSC